MNAKDAIEILQNGKWFEQICGVISDGEQENLTNAMDCVCSQVQALQAENAAFQNGFNLPITKWRARMAYHVKKMNEMCEENQRLKAENQKLKSEKEKSK